MNEQPKALFIGTRIRHESDTSRLLQVIVKLTFILSD
jgi:hypothetical protein